MGGPYHSHMITQYTVLGFANIQKETFGKGYKMMGSKPIYNRRFSKCFMYIVY